MRHVAHALLCRSAMLKHLAARLASAVGFVILSASVAQAATTLSLAWNASAEPVTGYALYRGTTSGQYTQSADVGKNVTATVTPTTINRVYYFVVKAYNSSGMSAPSTEVAAWLGTAWSTPTLMSTADFDGDGKADPMITVEIPVNGLPARRPAGCSQPRGVRPRSETCLSRPISMAMERPTLPSTARRPVSGSSIRVTRDPAAWRGERRPCRTFPCRRITTVTARPTSRSTAARPVSGSFSNLRTDSSRK